MDFDLKYPLLFYSTLIGSIIILIVTIKFIHEFWFTKKEDGNGGKVNIRLKVLTISVTLSMLIRFGFQLFDYYKYNKIVSLTGSCIAYFSGFLLYTFITYRLLATFKGSSYEISKYRLIILITILFLNMIYGMWTTTQYKITENWKEQSQLIIDTIYGIILFLINIWILMAFNSRLYKVILSTPNEFGDAIHINVRQTKWIHLITRQTLLISFILIYISIEIGRDIIFVLVSAFQTSKSTTIKWRFVTMIRRVLTAIFIYLSFPFNTSNTIYNVVCKPFHASCYKCCKCIVTQKLKASMKKIPVQGVSMDYNRLEDLTVTDNSSTSF